MRDLCCILIFIFETLHLRPLRGLVVARREKISDGSLCDAIKRAEKGNIDTDFKGGVISQRVARGGKEKREGYRTVILFKKGDKAFFTHGYERKKQNRVSDNEIKWYRVTARDMLKMDNEKIKEEIKIGELIEVKYND